MKHFQKWLAEHQFEAYAMALLLMLLPPVLLYYAAGAGPARIWALIGVVVLGNLLVVAIP
jgi:hypothetical protein